MTSVFAASNENSGSTGESYVTLDRYNIQSGKGWEGVGLVGQR